MTRVRSTGVLATVALVFLVWTGVGAASGRPGGTCPAAYRALALRSQALNSYYADWVAGQPTVVRSNASRAVGSAAPAAASGGFAWDDAGLGAASAVAAALLVVAAAAGVRRLAVDRRRRRSA
jgi:hypothetical protein